MRGDDVYFANRADGTVMRVARGGGPTAVIATDQKDPIGIAADADAVFWTNAGDGTIVTARHR